MKRKDIRYSIVIPVYNSDESLTEIVARLDYVFLSLLHESFEVVLFDDCSPNPSSCITIQRFVAAHKNIIGIRLYRNFGKAGAQICGFEHASGEFIITMDDDLQHQPEDIPLLISMQHHDVVMASVELSFISVRLLYHASVMLGTSAFATLIEPFIGLTSMRRSTITATIFTARLFMLNSLVNHLVEYPYIIPAAAPIANA